MPQLEELRYLRILFKTEGRPADGLGCEECQFPFYGWIAAGLRHPGGAGRSHSSSTVRGDS